MEHVELHADLVDTRAFHQGAFNLHVVQAARLQESAERMRLVFVDNQLVSRKITFRLSKAPFDEIVFTVEIAVFLRLRHSSPNERLVRHLPVRNPPGISFGQFAEPLVEAGFFMGDASNRPFRHEAVVIEAVRLRLDALRLAVFKTEVGRGATVDFGTVFCKTRLPLLRLQCVPVERKRRHVKCLRIIRFVFSVLLFFWKLAEHEEIRAVFEFMRLLADAQMRVFDRLAFRIDQFQIRISLAVRLDSGGDPVFHVVFFRFKRLQNVSA